MSAGASAAAETLLAEVVEGRLHLIVSEEGTTDYETDFNFWELNDLIIGNEIVKLFGVILTLLFVVCYNSPCF